MNTVWNTEHLRPETSLNGFHSSDRSNTVDRATFPSLSVVRCADDRQTPRRAQLDRRSAGEQRKSRSIRQGSGNPSRDLIKREGWIDPPIPPHTHRKKPFFFFFSFAFVVRRIELCQIEHRFLSFLHLNGKGAKGKRRSSAVQVHFDTGNFCSAGERRMRSSEDDWNKFISVRSLISQTKWRQRFLRTSFFFALKSASSTIDRCSCSSSTSVWKARHCSSTSFAFQ